MFRLQCGADRRCAGITLRVQAYGACSTSHYLSTLCVSTRFWLSELNLEPGDGLNQGNLKIFIFPDLLNYRAWSWVCFDHQLRAQWSYRDTPWSELRWVWYWLGHQAASQTNRRISRISSLNVLPPYIRSERRRQPSPLHRYYSSAVRHLLYESLLIFFQHCASARDFCCRSSIWSPETASIMEIRRFLYFHIY